MNRTARCIRMLMILKSRQTVCTSELAELLETNPRNIREYKKNWNKPAIPLKRYAVPEAAMSLKAEPSCLCLYITMNRSIF